jgi:ribosomal RNA methyltransferase Nop2
MLRALRLPRRFADGSDWSDEEELPPTKKAKTSKKEKAAPKKKKAASPEIERGPARELVFSDSEEEFDAAVNGDEQMPSGQHAFDLDLAPSEEEEDEMMDDDFGFPSEDDEMDEDDDVDSAFASDEEEGEGEGDEAMEEDDEDDEDGIQTNLEDDLDDEGYTLPAVDGVDEEHEHGVSLRDVENRMRWLVKVCTASKDEGIKGVAGK